MSNDCPMGERSEPVKSSEHSADYAVPEAAPRRRLRVPTRCRLFRVQTLALKSPFRRTSS